MASIINFNIIHVEAKHVHVYFSSPESNWCEYHEVIQPFSCSWQKIWRVLFYSPSLVLPPMQGWDIKNNPADPQRTVNKTASTGSTRSTSVVQLNLRCSAGRGMNISEHHVGIIERLQSDWGRWILFHRWQRWNLPGRSNQQWLIVKCYDLARDISIRSTHVVFKAGSPSGFCGAWDFDGQVVWGRIAVVED